jgi:hypothetical protein
MKSPNLIGALAENLLQKSSKMSLPEILHKAQKLKTSAIMIAPRSLIYQLVKIPGLYPTRNGEKLIADC